MAPAWSPRSLGPFGWFYLATPAFFLADWLWGINVRVVALDDLPVVKTLYYVGCFGCGVLTAARPDLTHTVGVTESALNVGLVIAAIPAAALHALNDMALARPVVEYPFPPLFFVNLGLSLAVCVTALFWHRYHLERQPVSEREIRRFREKIGR